MKIFFYLFSMKNVNLLIRESIGCKIVYHRIPDGQPAPARRQGQGDNLFIAKYFFRFKGHGKGACNHTADHSFISVGIKNIDLYRMETRCQPKDSRIIRCVDGYFPMFCQTIQFLEFSQVLPFQVVLNNCLGKFALGKGYFCIIQFKF